MNSVLVDLKQIEEFKKMKFIGSGKEGSCYLLNENEVIKMFYLLDKNRKINFYNLESSNIAFPRDIYLYLNTGLIQGYTMPYFIGEKFVDGFKNKLCLSNLKQAIEKIQKEIYNYPNIYMDDLCLANMMYDYETNEIKLIDTSKWYFKFNSKNENIKTLNDKLMLVLVRQLDFLNSSLIYDRNLHELYRMYKIGESLPIDFISAIETKFLNENSEKVETIGDLTRKLSKKY